MVDFNKLLGKKKLSKAVDPISIFTDLDKATGKENLKPSQAAVLREWHEKWRNKRDIIVKLHTGQGKTLIGLLMLKSSLNEGTGPALYICPNNYLVNQTIEQAQEFGIDTVQFAPDVTRPPPSIPQFELYSDSKLQETFQWKISVWSCWVRQTTNKPRCNCD